MTNSPAAVAAAPIAVLELPLLTESQNRRERAHWLERHKLVGRYRRLIGHQLSELLDFDPEALQLWPSMPHSKPSGTRACTAKGCDRHPVSKDERGQSWCDSHDLSRLPPSRRRIVVIRCSAGELDYGNLVGGCKPLVDAMVREGLIYDDAPRWLDESYQQQAAPKGKGRIVVEVFDEAKRVT